MSTCKGCDGSGIRAPACPSCAGIPVPDGYMIVERCDVCDQYVDDLEAAQAIDEESAVYVECNSGALHAIVRCQSPLSAADAEYMAAKARLFDRIMHRYGGVICQIDEEIVGDLVAKTPDQNSVWRVLVDVAIVYTKPGTNARSEFRKFILAYFENWMDSELPLFEE